MNPDIANRLEQIRALQRAGRAEDAARQLGELLVLCPNEPELHRAMAMLAQHDGRLDAAAQSMRQAVRLAPQIAGLQLEAGQVLAACGCIDEAGDAFRRAVALQPDLFEGWWLLGRMLYDARRDAEALPALRRAFALAPDRPDVGRALAEAEFALENHEQALPLFERLLVQSPLDPQLWLRLGRCCSRSGFPGRALEVLQEAQQRGLQSAEILTALAQTREQLGDADGARQAYEQAHALRPQWAEPVGGLLMLQRGQSAAALVDCAGDLLESGSLAEGERAYLHYALGKVLDARGGYADAMAHWNEANRLRRGQGGAMDRVALRQRVEDAVSAFTPALFAAMTAGGSNDERPIFIVGMPRSGTTLVEQIIATHPQAYGAGELTGLVRIADSLSTRDFRWPRDVAQVDAAMLGQQAAGYMTVAARRSNADAVRIVDKQPYNFFHVGLASLLFPRARVIWCRRDPGDISLSIYAENFAADASYATDFDDIAALIAAQEVLMRHWQDVSPLPILEVQYERLVADRECESRRLIDFAGLPWDDACLHFHSNPRAVQTPSLWQVRQPIHARSVGRWRNYATWMPASLVPQG